MKKTITLITLFFSLLSFSQQMSYEKGKFYLQGNRIDSREARTLFATNVKAATLFKQAKSKEGLGGFLLGLGIGLTVGDFTASVLSDREYPTVMTYIGAASLAGSIPILCGRKKRILEAVEIYNSEHKELKLGAENNSFELNAVANQNGFGLQLKF